MFIFHFQFLGSTFRPCFWTCWFCEEWIFWITSKKNQAVQNSDNFVSRLDDLPSVKCSSFKQSRCGGGGGGLTEGF